MLVLVSYHSKPCVDNDQGGQVLADLIAQTPKPKPSEMQSLLDGGLNVGACSYAAIADHDAQSPL